MYDNNLNKSNCYVNKRCCNCGRLGHIYKNCKEPKTSLGIISFKKKQKNIQYLMIQSRNTHGFVEFLKGKYSLNDIIVINI